MLKILLARIARTWKQAVSQQQIGFILVIFFVFPLVCTYMLQQFLAVASAQADIAHKNSVTAHHESIIALLQNTDDTASLSPVLSQLVASIDTLTAAHIVTIQPDGATVVAASDRELVGTLISDSRMYQSAIGQPTGLIYPFERNSERVWRSYREVSTPATQWFIYTETNLSSLDTRVQQQLYSGYTALALMVAFLTMVAWWLWRQPDIAARLTASQLQLQEQYNFTNMMVHELRAPLTAIRGYASMIEDSQLLPTQQQEQMHKISASASRLTRLVNDFLEVARLQAGTLKVTNQSIDVRTIATSVVDEQKSVAEAKGLAITATVPVSAVTLATDSVRLQQIVTNLVSNAVKYTDTGSVTLVVSDNKSSVEIRIKDTGHGISAADQTKLFKPFMRVGNADAGKEIGSGLGMWITKQLVELLGGKVSIESIEGVGTHAIINLPKSRTSK